MSYLAYKYRIYPNKNQKVLISKTFGCCRYVYNRGLARKMEVYQKNKKGISVFKLMNEIAKWKNEKETEWLKEVNSQALQSSLRNLDMAYTAFFHKQSQFPKFKSKCDSHQSFCNPQNTIVDFDKNKVFIPKFKNGIRAVLHRKFEGTIKSSTVSKTPSGKYYISILVEQNDYSQPPNPLENKTLGIDLGVKDYATFSDGTIIPNPKHLQRKLKRLKFQQRKLSKKKKGSNNREKQRKKVAILHEKVANSRNDFLNKLTNNIAKNQSYESFAIEDLNIVGLLKDGKKKKINKHITDAAWGTFRRFLTYKCEKNSKNLLIIGRFDPSSKLCGCGYLNNNLTLKDREWICPSCKTNNQRDLLAAKNIKRFAFCQQNTSKELSVPQELRKLSRKTKKPLESGASFSLKKEASRL